MNRLLLCTAFLIAPIWLTTPVMAESGAGEHFNRGNNLRAEGDYDKAIAEYNQALQLDPTLGVAYNNRGITWDRKHEYDKAIADFNAALRINPNDAEVLVNRGNAWDETGEFDKAIADLNDALRLDPNSAEAYYNRAIIWNHKRGYQKAISDYNEALRLDPKDADAYINLALLKATCADANCRDGKRAVVLANKALALTDGKVWQAMDVLAASYAESGDFRKACECETKAIEMAAKDKSAQPKDIQEARSCLELYKQGKPYHKTD
jgi:tetratricopeptide (TPR) repeat protein